VTLITKVDTTGVNSTIYPYSSESVTIPDILPLDFKGAKWFKIHSASAIVGEGDGVGDFGAVTFNDLSSFVGGAADIGDTTTLMILGATPGMNRSFVFDTVDNNTDTYDKVESWGAITNYMGTSPKDMTVSALNITIDDMGTNAGTQYRTTEGSYIFELKGSLL
jgi:hypothetical protein